MGVLWQVEQGFNSFFANFLAWRLMIFQSGVPKELCNFDKSSNLSYIRQKIKKSLVQLALKPIFRLISGTLQVPNPSVVFHIHFSKYI